MQAVPLPLGRRSWAPEAEGSWEGGGEVRWSDSQQHPWMFPERLPCLLFKKGIGDSGYLPLRWEIMRREAEVRGGRNPLLSSQIRGRKWDGLLWDQLSACRCLFSFPPAGRGGASERAGARPAVIAWARRRPPCAAGEQGR